MSFVNSLRESAQRYPTCYVANCECDEFNGEWKLGCMCLGHAREMDMMFGRDHWQIAQEPSRHQPRRHHD